MAEGGVATEVTKAPESTSDGQPPKADQPVSTPKDQDRKEPTPLQKWLDGLEGAMPGDEEALEELRFTPPDYRKEDKEAILRRLNNRGLKEGLPILMERIRKKETGIDSFAEILQVNFEHSRWQYEDMDYSEIRDLEKKVDKAVNSGNLVAVSALLNARLLYLRESQWYQILEKRAFDVKRRSIIAKPLSEAEKELLDETGQEITYLNATIGILRDQYGVLFTEYSSWEEILDAPPGPNPPTPVTKA